MKNSADPIGIFDSGIGGLTVVKAITERLPGENIIYFGDTTHLPYGEKSTAAIQAYSIKIADLLVSKGCKLILIACNSASAAAFELVQEYVDGKALVLNVIDPVISHLATDYLGKQVGLIGTKQTVNSNVYSKKLEKLGLPIKLASKATPLLASVIEEGFGNTKIVEEVLNEYLSHPSLDHIDALLLACTHYPVIKQQIAKYYGNTLHIIDTTEIIAKSVQDCLTLHHLMHEGAHSFCKFYVSDYTESFCNATKVFFGSTLQLEYYPLWG